MNYCLFRCVFQTPVHIGGGGVAQGLVKSETMVHSDTVFSALFIEAVKIGVSKQFYEVMKSGKANFSSLFPYKKDEYFLPKPICKIHQPAVGPALGKYKLYKKLTFIPASQFDSYQKNIKGQDVFDVEKALNMANGVAAVDTRVNVALKGTEESEPYYVGITSFAKDGGLYVILAYEDSTAFDLLTMLFTQLSYAGIGGKRSAGLGKFTLSEPIHLKASCNESLDAISKLLENRNSGAAMTLNVSLPSDEELDRAVEGGYFALLRRGGFIQSCAYGDQAMKKKTLYAFAEGACFREQFSGQIAEFSRGGNHPVYRFLKPIFLGVDL